MDQDTNKLIEEQLKTLPVPLQRAVAQTSWRVFVGNVAKANNLDDTKKESLETETMLVIYGFETQSDFVGNIMRELSIDIARATMIANEVDKQVFTPILNKANELQSEVGEETLQSVEVEPEAPTTLAPTVLVEKHPDLPMVVPSERPKTALTFEERKKLVPNLGNSKVHYEGGKDPYREQI